MIRRSPSFSGFKPASTASSRVKSKNRHIDTEHERILRLDLWRNGLRYRKNVVSLPGKPDIVFSSARVVVFCDGDFWHGRKWRSLRSQLKRRADSKYWLAKIASNIRRDKHITKSLVQAGWQVIRLCEIDIKKNPAAAVEQIKIAVLKQPGTTVESAHNG